MVVTDLSIWFMEDRLGRGGAERTSECRLHCAWLAPR